MHGPKSAAPAHESARLHVTGQAAYVDDLVELEGTLHAALGLSEHAHARIRAIDLDAVRRAPGVVRVVTAADIPGANNCGPILQDDPVLAETEVCYFGQPVFAVLAETRDQARHAARLARIDYAPLPAEFSPIEAAARGRQVVPPLHLVRGDAAQVLATAPRRLAGCFEVGGQEHFYLEGQVSYAVPREGEGLHIWCSTQHPSEMQSLVCGLLELRAHQVVVETRRMGGGFGGKESQSALFCCLAALGARLSGRPVKLRPDRDEDFLITGKRHAVSYRYEVGFEPGGRILALRLEMVLDAGYSADLSAPVATRAVCHVDNAYYLDAVDVRAVCARTHTQSNTAFRGFGGPQGALAVEYVIDDIARALDLDPLFVRRANFYAGEGRDTTPYGQKVEDNVIVELVDALVGDSDYPTRRQAIARFNADSTVLKKGLALTPVKFGISFNLVHFNQGGALVHVYTDGSVLINHGGTEMGQGLHTKVAQVVADTLGISMDRVRASATDTSKVANTSATAASTGADLNAMAAHHAAARIRQRLAAFAAETWGGSAEQVEFAADRVRVGGHELDFEELVGSAYRARVQLWSDGFYATPGLNWDAGSLRGHPFHYFAYGAAVSEVMIDTLTGEWKLVRADLLHDAGKPINSAIDIGQVEGGFIQGMGWLTLEELYRDAEGRLRTHAPSTYKIPAVGDCPAILNTRLYPNANQAETIMRSKAVGEPPLLLAFSVFFAIRDAIASAVGSGSRPPLAAPATPEAILQALDRAGG